MSSTLIFVAAGAVVALLLWLAMVIIGIIFQRPRDISRLFGPPK